MATRLAQIDFDPIISEIKTLLISGLVLTISYDILASRHLEYLPLPFLMVYNLWNLLNEENPLQFQYPYKNLFVRAFTDLFLGWSYWIMIYNPRHPIPQNDSILASYLCHSYRYIGPGIYINLYAALSVKFVRTLLGL